MENLDHLVDLITDRLMEKLKKKPQKPSVYVIGGDKIPDLLEGEGFAQQRLLLWSHLVLMLF